MEENNVSTGQSERKYDVLVRAIGEKVISDLFKLENDYSIEYDEYGFCSASYGISFYHEYGNSGCDVKCSVSWPEAEIELNLYGCEGIHEKRYKKLDRICDAVGGFLDVYLNTDDLLSAIKKDYQDACADEWQQHGFRDAADYYSWRYG